MKYKEIATLIIALKDADLKLREQLIQEGRLGHEYNKEMEQIHNRNASLLNEIIDRIGYPTIEKVGEEANQAAWLVIQHAIAQPNFMKRCLLLLEKEATYNKVYKINLAYLSDRIATFEGKLQSYGTQFDWDENGDLSPYPFDDLIKVNQRRKSIGLNTLEEQTVVIRQQAKKENQSPPNDVEQRKKKFEEWKISVGWSTNTNLD